MGHLPICPIPARRLPQPVVKRKNRPATTAKKNEQYRQHRGGHDSPVRLFLVGYRYLDANFCAPGKTNGTISLQKDALHFPVDSSCAQVIDRVRITLELAPQSDHFSG